MLAVFFYFLIAIALGLPLVYKLVAGRLALPAQIGLAYLLGTSLIGLEYFFAIFAFGLTDYSVLLWSLPVQILALALLFPDVLNIFKPIKFFAGWGGAEKALLAVLVTIVLMSGAQAWLKPVMFYDAMNMWSYKAKLAYENPVGFLTPASSAYYANTWHANYPWQLPFNQVLLSQLNGVFDDALNNFVFVGYFVAILLLLYGGTLLYNDRSKALFFTLLFATTPFIFFHSFNAYADLPLASMGLAGLVFFVLWAKTDKKLDLWLALGFWALAFLIKNEGALFLLSGLFILLAKTIKEKSFKQYWLAALFGLPVVAWVLYLKLSGLGLSHGDAVGGWGFHPEVFSAFFSNMFLASSWNILWYIAAAWTVVYWRAIKANKQLYPVLAWWLMLASMFVAIYLFGPSYVNAVDQTAFGRNLLLFIAPLFLIFGINEKQ